MEPSADYVDINFDEDKPGGGPLQYEDAGGPVVPEAQEPAQEPAPADSRFGAAATAKPPEAKPATRPKPPEVMPIREEPAEPEDSLGFDWLTEAAIPVGIFGLLGCLLYFLIDLRAALGGEFSSGLRWVCFWFLLAAILITRIHTKYGTAALALPYVLGLAGATGLFIWHFTFSAGAMAERFTGAGQFLSLFFNFALVGLVWWGAYKVTRECTLEENVEYSLGEGFLAELVGGRRRREARAAHGAEESRGRHPGRVILWVSLIAVLAFGLGAHRVGDQGHIAAHAFWCMVGYVFFALFLLALTNLSAVRMDVRQRKVAMTRGITVTWIASSLALVVFIILASALLPRGTTERTVPWSFAPRASWLREPTGRTLEGGPTGGLGQPPPEGSSSPGREAETTGEGIATDKGDKGSSGSGSPEGNKGSLGLGGQTPVGEGMQGGGSSGGAGTQGAGGGGGSSSQSSQSSASAGRQSTSAQTQGSNQQEQPQGGGSRGKDQAASSKNASRGQKGSVSARFPWWLLLLLLLLLALLVYLLIRNREKIIPFLQAVAAPFRAMWLALLAFLERLREKLRARRRQDEFADLPEDPFADIWEQRELLASLTPAQVVRHVYRAFLAFCSLRGHPRADATAEYEFLRYLPPRLGLEEPDQRTVTGAYVFATYSPGQVRAEDVERVRDVWTRLRPAIDAGLEANRAAGRRR